MDDLRDAPVIELKFPSCIIWVYEDVYREYISKKEPSHYSPHISHIHRIDGPAVIYEHSNEYMWVLDGKSLPFQFWLELTPLTVAEKAEIVLLYG